MYLALYDFFLSIHNNYQGGNQYWMLSKTGEIRRDEACLDNNGGSVILYSCHSSKGNQEWIIQEWGGIKNPSSGKCLTLTENKVIDNFILKLILMKYLVPVY